MPGFVTNLRHALAGLKQFFSTEQNGIIQLFIAIAAVAAGMFFKISATEWCLVLGCIALVLSLEMLNTAIEKLCNHVTPDFHPAIKIIKDISAGAVLWSAVCAAIIGVIVFYKYVTGLF